MSIFMTADLHFSHQNILKYESRPWDNIEDMDNGLVERWNSVVSSEDTVFVLGDVALGKLDESLKNINRLNGYKILVSGNHDRTFWAPGASEKKINKAQRSIERYQQAGFLSVVPGPAQLDVVISDRNVKACHFPYAGDSGDEDRYSSARPLDRGGWLIHGHVHGKWRVNGRQINVGVDVWNGFPVHEDAIMNIITGADTSTEPYTWEVI